MLSCSAKSLWSMLDVDCSVESPCGSRVPATPSNGGGWEEEVVNSYCRNNGKNLTSNDFPVSIVLDMNVGLVDSGYRTLANSRTVDW